MGSRRPCAHFARVWTIFRFYLSHHDMRLRLVGFLGCSLCVLTMLMGVVRNAPGQGVHPEMLSADDLAQALSIHWWILQAPADVKSGDQVYWEVVGPDGKPEDGSGSFRLEATDANAKIRIYCWEDENLHRAKVVIQTRKSASNGTFTDYFEGRSSSGPTNGSVVNSGDVVLKFDSATAANFTGDNTVLSGQVGLKFGIEKGEQ
jgi:hypothetical protein